MYKNSYNKILNVVCILDIRGVISMPPFSLYNSRYFCDFKENNNVKTPRNDGINNLNYEPVQPGLESKYTIFKDDDAPILLDVYEERFREESKTEEVIEEFHGLSLERGITGVFDIDDLVELLRRDKAEDIFVVQLPPEARYVDHIVIVSGRSRKHMIALAQIVRRMFKKKRNSTDLIPRIEGENSSMWMAMDLGNIALHIFSQDARRVYDLESLWSVGSEYDLMSNNQEDPLITLLKKHSITLSDVSLNGQLL